MTSFVHLPVRAPEDLMSLHDIKKTTETKMDQSIAAFKNNLTKVRTGRANPAHAGHGACGLLRLHGAVESGGQPVA
jgi:hypothetical protein